MQIAGLSLGQSQYYMGHLIAEGIDHGSDYNNKTMLINMLKKLGYYKSTDASDTSAL